MNSDTEFDKTIIQRRSWESFFKSGKEALKRKNYDRAERDLWAALEDANKLGKDDPRQGNIHSALAEVYQKSNKLDDAAECYKKTIEIWENTLGNNYSGLIPTLTNYSHLLRKMKKNDEAEEMVKRSNEIKKNNEESYK